ncbi:uncharacterized protein TRIADDRAFT_58991 [Trichoplax adhaerens]|uniref:G-protein coupled receptors family 1 profile domain-containing protein n=1 Tax=Trichoplax adhaerens TaxID=10228 RepID=B3S484_TRIAD|nr:hypothetical protein TRIADDRAFT_58991 [Trichoplax adhaerens]EDV22410.1 hypothetical protein TRIADDRAFT_58991 [Trichoplax adhaerens]|eukprot:XP_002114954.1 hypothetical protein TRIADDRAFT_58991 [Trichoplax adhaerens]
MNNSTTGPVGPTQLSTLQITFITLYAILGFIGTVGNTIIIISIITVKKMKTPINILILNLALAGFLMSLFYIPISMITQFTTNYIWTHGQAMCKIYYTVTLWSVQVISYTQVAICINRYQGIHLVMKKKYRMNIKTVMIVNLIIWIFALLFCVPYLMYLRVVPQRNNITHCLLVLPLTSLDFAIDGKFVSFFYFMYAASYLLVAYLIPFVIMVMFYGIIIKGLRQRRLSRGNFNNDRNELHRSISMQRKERVIKLFIACVVIYFIANLPYAISLLLFIIHKISWQIFISIRYYLTILQVFGVVSNALLYGYFNTGIRNYSASIASKSIRRSALITQTPNTSFKTTSLKTNFAKPLNDFKMVKSLSSPALVRIQRCNSGKQLKTASNVVTVV